MAPPQPPDVHNVKASAQYHLREFLITRGRLQSDSSASRELESRLRNQAGMMLSDLSTLQAEVRSLAKAAESGRWKRFLLGGAM
jgi:hypothetical protein